MKTVDHTMLSGMLKAGAVIYSVLRRTSRSKETFEYDFFVVFQGRIFSIGQVVAKTLGLPWDGVNRGVVCPASSEPHALVDAFAQSNFGRGHSLRWEAL